MASYRLTVNGESRTAEALPDTPLLWVLRDDLELTGTKFGCGMGVCGSCTVHLNGQAARSCVVAVSDVGDREITTIEGLAGGNGHPLQRAWVEEDVPQCGYCQAGQIMTAAALLEENPDPTDQEIQRALQGNVCRCGTYLRIQAAIRRAAEEIR